MQRLAKQFLTTQEQQRITECVQQAERKTSGEIVPMVVSSSHSYPLADIIGGCFIAFPSSLLAAHLTGPYFWVGPDNMWIFLSFLIIFYPLAHLLVRRTSWLKQRFLLPQRVNQEVETAATAAFFTEQLYRTKAHNGVLLYISVFERRVCVLGDKGISDKIPQQSWQEIVQLVTNGIRQKRQTDAICDAIVRIGEILKDHFPAEADDKNELHNLIIR